MGGVWGCVWVGVWVCVCVCARACVRVCESHSASQVVMCMYIVTGTSAFDFDCL